MPELRLLSSIAVRLIKLIPVLALSLALSACQSGSRGKAPANVQPQSSRASFSYSKTGTASFYSNRLHGGPTASGARYNRYALTAANNALPLGSRVRVTHLASGRTVDVLINDRMGHKKRIIDLSYAAASKLGMVRQGLAKVRVDLISTPEVRRRRR